MEKASTRAAELQEAIASSNEKHLRPIITSLNGDNSWLWSIPRPIAERYDVGKAYYHIIFEPWLNGPTSVFSSWLIHIALSEAPAASTAADVDRLIWQIESAVSISSEPGGNGAEAAGDSADTAVDAILLGIHYPDHLHRPTLVMFDKRIPVVATSGAAALIKPWNHFDNISIISDLPGDATTWKDVHPGGLPPWLTTMRLPGHHELNYCLALVWTHSDTDGTEIHETIIQSPHGTRVDQAPLQAFLTASPPTEKLALFHGLKESHAMTLKNTYGAEGGLELYRALGGTRYWVVSHSSLLSYSGAVMRMFWVYDTKRTLDWALGREADSLKGKGNGYDSPDPRLVEVTNGGFSILA